MRDLSFISGEPLSNVEAEVEISDDSTYWIVMSQDCDLNQDFNQRKETKTRDSKNIRSILICPAYPARKFYSGQHIPGWALETFNDKKVKKIIRNDEYKRYHYLKGDEDLGVPELVIDFKHFYTIPVEVAYRQRSNAYLVTLNELHREDLSHRFSHFLSRIGLPDVV